MFAGAVTFAPDAPPFDDALLKGAWRAALSPLRPPEREGFWRGEGARLMEQRMRPALREQHQPLPMRCPDTGVAIAFWGRLDNRRELLRGPADDDLDDGELLLAAWHRWGRALPERLVGDFALAVVDPRRRLAFLARDPLGTKPLYYRLDGGSLTFATTVAAIKATGGRPLTPDMEWMARYLWDLAKSHDRTAYREVRKLPPGCRLTLEGSRSSGPERWHCWRDDPPPARQRAPARVEVYRERLEDAVRCRVDPSLPLGAEISGGLDSSTVTLLLSRLLESPAERLYGFSLTNGERDPDLILSISQTAGIARKLVITAELAERDEDVEQGLRILGYPEKHYPDTGYLPFYRECGRQGIPILFSGAGGDETVTHPGHHLRRELLDERGYARLWESLPGPWPRRLAHFVRQLTGRDPLDQSRLEFQRIWQARWPHRPWRDEVVERFGLYDAYRESADRDTAYRRINDAVLGYGLGTPQLTTRLEHASLMAAAHGVDCRWPLLDARLIQHYLSTPSIEKFGPAGIGRYLHRRAVRGVVPDSVAWRLDKGGAARDLQRRGRLLAKRSAERARRHEAHLHPALEALIDREKLRRQIARAIEGEIDGAFFTPFRFSTNALIWLNHWLHDGEVPG